MKQARPVPRTTIARTKTHALRVKSTTTGGKPDRPCLHALVFLNPSPLLAQKNDPRTKQTDGYSSPDIGAELIGGKDEMAK